MHTARNSLPVSKLVSTFTLQNLGLYVLSASALLSTSGAAVGLGLLVLGVFLDREFWKTFPKSPLFYLIIVSGIYLAINTVLAIRRFPDSASMQYDQALCWFQLWCFIFVGWAVRGDLKKAALLLSLCLFGLLAGMALYTAENWEIVLKGVRTGFHLRVIAFSLYCATGLLGMLVFGPQLTLNKKSGKTSILKLIIWELLLLMLVRCFIIAKSRGAWISAIIVIPATIVLQGRLTAKRKPKRLKYVLTLAAMFLASIFILVYVNSMGIESRVSKELPMIKATLKGQFDKVPTWGFGVRVQAARFALKKIIKRPILGWGPGSTAYMIRHSGDPSLLHPLSNNRKAYIDHLHNTYLEIFFRFGIIGALLFVLTLYYLVAPLITKIKKGDLPLSFACFILVVFPLIGIWCLSDFRLLHHDWRSYWIIITGVAFGIGWEQDKALKKEALPLETES